MKRLISIILCTVFMIIIFSSCSIKTDTATEAYNPDTTQNNLTDSNLEFAFDIFKHTNESETEKNVFISPFSISSALTMTYNGARKSTASNMAQVMHYEGIHLDNINKNYKKLMDRLNAYKDVALDIGNSIWLKKGSKINSGFISTNQKMFGAYSTELDFDKSDAALTINHWISHATKNKINKMVDPPLPKDVIMYIMNAIYFKGQWAKPFEKKFTYDTTFTLENGKQKKIKMMSLNNEVMYGLGGDFKAVKLPYGKGNTAMYCILPENGTKINEFIEKLSKEKWKEIRKCIKKTEEVVVQIPRFKMEYGIKSLKEVLTTMGLNVPFSDTADFSGIGQGISISDVLHKAIIEVNEEGSEAVGVTNVEIKATAVAIDPKTFIANRPMVFMIVDDATNTILFMGKLYDVG